MAGQSYAMFNPDGTPNWPATHIGEAHSIFSEFVARALATTLPPQLSEGILVNIEGQRIERVAAGNSGDAPQVQTALDNMVQSLREIHALLRSAS